MSKWQVMRNVGFWQVWKQTRERRPGEPMHSGLRDVRGAFATQTEAQEYADKLNMEVE